MPQAQRELLDPGVQGSPNPGQVMQEPKSPPQNVWLLSSSLELEAWQIPREVTLWDGRGVSEGFLALGLPQGG